jgi:hypothetical protein
MKEIQRGKSVAKINTCLEDVAKIYSPSLSNIR